MTNVCRDKNNAPPSILSILLTHSSNQVDMESVPTRESLLKRPCLNKSGKVWDRHGELFFCGNILAIALYGKRLLLVLPFDILQTVMARAELATHFHQRFDRRQPPIDSRFLQPLVDRLSFVL